MKKLSGKEKATILLSIIGPQKAARLLRQLPEEVSNLLAAQVASLPKPSEDIVQLMLRELSSNLIEKKDVKAIESNNIEEEIEAEAVEEENIEKDVIVNEQDEFVSIPIVKIAEVLKNEKFRIQNMVLHILEEDKSKELKKILSIEIKKSFNKATIEDIPIYNDIKQIVIRSLIHKVKAL
jgi:flagellar motor switch protein FliG